MCDRDGCDELFLRSDRSAGGAAAATAKICIAAEFVGASNECISLRALGSFIDLLPFFLKGSMRLVVMTEALLQLRSKSTLQTSGCIFKRRRRASLKRVHRKFDLTLFSFNFMFSFVRLIFF